MVCCRESWSQSPQCLMWQGHIMKHALSENRNENKTKQYKKKQESRVLYGAPTTKRQKPNIIALLLAGPDILAQCRRRNRGAQRILLTTPQPPKGETVRTRVRKKKRWSVRPCVCERSRTKKYILLSRESPADYGLFLGFTTNSAVPQQRDRAPA